ncbi:MAG: LysR family transcriptional regulator, partial [Alphaproteobacteria bacterium]
MAMMNWRRLHIFETVMAAGSLTSAAERLGLSQPTIGRQIRT